MSDTVTTTLCWKCSKEYFASHARCPYCAATNASKDLAKAEAEMGLRPETIYEKSARWNWPDGSPDL